jgi:hypothetical protein
LGARVTIGATIRADTYRDGQIIRYRVTAHLLGQNTRELEPRLPDHSVNSFDTAPRVARDGEARGWWVDGFRGGSDGTSSPPGS